MEAYYFLGVVISGFILTVQDSMGQEYCDDRTLSTDQLFQEHPLHRVKSETSLGRRSVQTLDDCLELCLATDGCYGVDWNFKKKPWRRTRCWMHVGEEMELTDYKFVNHHRRLPCPETATTGSPVIETVSTESQVIKTFSTESQVLDDGVGRAGHPAIPREFSDGQDMQIYFMPNVRFTQHGVVTEITYYWGDVVPKAVAFFVWRYFNGGNIEVVSGISKLLPPTKPGKNTVDIRGKHVEDIYNRGRMVVEDGDYFSFLFSASPQNNRTYEEGLLHYDLATSAQCTPTLIMHGSTKTKKTIDEWYQDVEYYPEDQISRLECRIYSLEVLLEVSEYTK